MSTSNPPVTKWLGSFSLYQQYTNFLTGRGKDDTRLDRESGCILRGSREDDSTRKHKAYTDSFDNGLQRIKNTFDHMVRPAYQSQSSWDFYEFFVFEQNTSEGICDALLAVSAAMKRFNLGTFMPDGSLVKLSKHIIQQTLKFLEDDIPHLVQYPKGLYKNLWSSQFASSTSQGLKRSMEETTTKFVDNLTNSFSESSNSSWTHAAALLHEAFKEFAISFEDSLGKEWHNGQQSRARAISVSSIDDDNDDDTPPPDSFILRIRHAVFA